MCVGYGVYVGYGVDAVFEAHPDIDAPTNSNKTINRIYTSL